MRFKRRLAWPLIGLLALALSLGACTSEKWGAESAAILEKAQQSDTGPVELGGETIVSSEEFPALREKINSTSDPEQRKEIIARFLTRQDRNACILKELEEAETKKEEVKCDSIVLVEKDDVPALAAELRSLDNNAQRTAVAGYILEWEREKRLDSTIDSLKQIKNTRSLPLLGGLIDMITRFPVTWEGEVMVPKDEIPDLIDQINDAPDEDAKRAVVESYLTARGALPQPAGS